MKLVDILARDLVEWPAEAKSLSQSFGGMVFYVNAGMPVRELFRAKVSEDWRHIEVTRAEWQTAVDALKRESPALHVQVPGRGQRVMPWDGDGYPPVGANVESKDFGGVTVLAHGIFRGQTVIICQGDDTVITCTPDQLTPLRTAEQIAAEERKAQILEMIDVFGLDTSIWGLDAVREICGHLWAAGYRKQPK